jgi:ABC-type amino acid transport substrate-binding protein
MKTFRPTLAWMALALLAWTTGPTRCENLRIGTEGDYPPFNFYNADGRLTGFEVDLGNQLCDIIEASCQWEPMPFGQLIPALLAGRIDAIMGSLAITQERSKRIAFSAKYYSTPIRFVAERNRTLTIDPARLSGLRIGVVAGTTHVEYLDRNFGAAVEPTLFTVQHDMMSALLDGGLDLVLGDGLSLWSFLNTPQGAAFTWVGNPIYVDKGIGVALRPGNQDLVDRFDRAIDKVLKNGTYLRVNSRYFPFNIY